MINNCYIHIPFCKNICSYCDFCKLFYNEKLVDQYLEQLEKELLFAMKKEKPSMFSQTTSTQYAYSAMVGDSDSNGIVSILQKYRKN